VFYINVKADPSGKLEKYESYLFIFACISSGMGLLLLLSFLYTGCGQKDKNTTKKDAPFTKLLKTILGLEILLEDIPQFILGALITHDLGNATPEVVFTWTTSAYNFILNLLDMIEIEEDAEISEGIDGLELQRAN
jgi:hypothetical protein